jgi:ATP/maltotriose-dependent transcriptional regulator MalT
MVDIDGTDPFSAGSRALARGAWRESRDLFQRAVALEETPEAIEGIATAAWWLDDAPIVFENRERAYRLYRERGDRLGAARMATGIAMDHYLYRGDTAIASGWLQRAHRLLEGTEPSAEHGWLAHWEAYIALFDRNEVDYAHRLSTEALALGQALGLIDLETISLALQGLALVSEGQVENGMRRLDEATTVALAGEVTDPDAVVTTCCYLIYACERVRDYPRAVQWCAKVETVARRWAYRSMFPICRSHYAAVLIWRGDWTRAETELTAAAHELMTTRPGWVLEPIVRLAELRRRQGRRDEAAALFEQVRYLPHALLGLAELALDDGAGVTATDLVDRFFRRVPCDDQTVRAEGQELAVRAWLSRGDLTQARTALADLESTAAVVGATPLRAACMWSRGLVLAAAGDLTGARHCLEDAIDRFDELGAPFETARARVELACVLLATDRRDSAVSEAKAALETLRNLGAWQELRRAEPVLRELGLETSDGNTNPSADPGLTRRETEVLRLIAGGLDNHGIAERLYISVRTVERHVSSIYGKIGAEGAAARAIATMYAFERGLARVLHA